MTVGLLHHVEFVNVMHKILVTHCVAGVGRERTIAYRKELIHSCICQVHMHSYYSLIHSFVVSLIYRST